MIKLENIVKNFGDAHVLKNVNLTVSEGEKLVVIGPSGSGKSTLIRCMDYLEEPTSGKVTVDGYDLNLKKDLAKVRQSTAMVFQQFNLYPHMTVLENLTLAPTKLQNISKKDAEESGLKYLEKVGLKEKANAYPSQLSGGQQQRVAIARALVNEPVMVLADEATGNLDTRTSYEIMNLMQELNQQQKKTIVFVTHEPDIAAFSSRTIMLRDGKVQKDNFNINPRSAKEALISLPVTDDY